MSDQSSNGWKERIGTLVTVVTLVTLVFGLGVTWATMTAQVTALDLVDSGLMSRITRLETTIESTNQLALENQRTLATIDAKLDMLLKDWRASQ